jgi:hypothetical protein
MSRFSCVSLVYTLNMLAAGRFEARIPAGTIGFCVTSSLVHAEYTECVFPRVNWVTLVVDRSRLSSNFMWWTGTAVTSPLLGKRTDVYN